MKYHDKIGRQLYLFLLIGGFQFAVDTMLLWLMVIADVPVSVANITSRAIAACTGLYLNRRFTFRLAGHRQAVSKQLHIRFWLFWLVMTALSTGLMQSLPTILFAEQGKDSLYLLTTKIGIEIFLFCLSFLISRQLVFRNV